MGVVSFANPNAVCFDSSGSLSWPVRSGSITPKRSSVRSSSFGMGSPPSATPGYIITSLSSVVFRVVTRIFENVVSEHMPLCRIDMLPIMMAQKERKIAIE